MRKAISSKILLAVFGVFLAFLILEAAFRLLNIVEFKERFAPQRQGQPFAGNPTLYMNPGHELFGWFFVPNNEFIYAREREDFRVRVKINSRGLRDREYPYEKGEGVFRILVLGDSFSAALQVPLEQIWHEIVERRLNGPARTNTKVEIINAGVPGWGTGQQLLYYRHEGYKYSPDLILLQFYHNDIANNDPTIQGRRPELDKPFFVQNGEQLELKNFPYQRRGPSISPLWRYFFSPLVNKMYRVFFSDREMRGVPSLLMDFASNYSPDYQARWRLTTRLIKELNTEATKHGARLAVLYIPDMRQVHPRIWDETLSKTPQTRGVVWDLDKPNRSLGKFLEQEGISYLDWTASFRERAVKEGRPFYFLRDHHLNPEGNRLGSDLLYEWLLKERRVPR